MTLAEFLEARIAEDEADARLAAQGFSTSEWTLDGGIYAGHESDEVVDWAYQETRQHIARWDPARVLAECAAKRRIVAEHAVLANPFEQVDYCRMCVALNGFAADSPSTGQKFPCVTLKALALPYSTHPDFDPSWQVGDTP